MELKSAQTVSSTMPEGLRSWNRLADQTGGLLIYGGGDCQPRNDILVRSRRGII